MNDMALWLIRANSQAERVEIAERDRMRAIGIADGASYMLSAPPWRRRRLLRRLEREAQDATDLAVAVTNRGMG